MRRRPVLAAALATAVAFGPWSHAAPTPQVTDPAGDANFLNGQGIVKPPSNDNPTPVGSQAYADVVSVLWEKAGRNVRVTATFSAPPAPPAGTRLVYRMLGTTPTCDFVGVVWYSSKSSDPAIPKAAVRDYCTGATVLTEVPEPKIDGANLIWTVPLSKFPKQAVGKTLTDLRVEIREMQDFGMPVNGAYGYAYGVIEQAVSTGTFNLK